MGARSVDPKITCQLIVTGDWSLPGVKEAEATNSLVDQGVDVITSHVDSPKVLIETAEKRGIYTCGYHANQSALAPKGYLTGAEWNWLTPYTQHIKDAQAGAPFKNFVRGGMKEGFVKMSPYGKPVSDAAKKKADGIHASMMERRVRHLQGPAQGQHRQGSHRRRHRAQADRSGARRDELPVEGVVGKI